MIEFESCVGCGGVGDSGRWSDIDWIVKRRGVFELDETGGDIGQEEVGRCIGGGVVESYVCGILRSCRY